MTEICHYFLILWIQWLLKFMGSVALLCHPTWNHSLLYSLHSECCFLSLSLGMIQSLLGKLSPILGVGVE